ncbi:SpaH/EbpB family LPXTG-anchored major pilin [Faecalibaculum rodentium]|uniref:SpaH/EbpB family LPXTG-anchored major pilin n=1 Tax=Faecalibaculum rodentium TaxID=1702221 RepID=UPI0023F2CD34|nr:SpaH/EbpB family LPXTG-anchored major pilin [Faecalibaculum rodentium]
MNKNFKKMFSVAAAATMVAGVGLTTVNAAELAAGEGTITIANAQKGKTYTAYQIFEVSATEQTHDVINPGVEFDDKRTASYIATEEQKTFFASANPELFNFQATANGKYNVAVKTGITGQDIATFLNSKEVDDLNKVFDHKSVTADTAGALSITDVPYGYYYVKTDAGTIASINTATPSVTITDKNKPTNVDKKVNDPENTQVDADHSTAYVGEIKSFEITTNIEPGLKSFTITDTMGTGLELVADSISITPSTLTNDKDYSVSVDGQKITVAFKDTYLQRLTASTSVTITYRATVTDAAVSAGSVRNTVVVKPGDNDTVNDFVKIFLGKADFTKVDANDEATTLAGAEFEIYTEATEGTKLSFIKDGDTYRYVQAPVDGDSSVTTLTSGTDGQFHVTGLPEGSYWLQETKAPAGYNLMTSRQQFNVTLNDTNVSNPSMNEVKANIENTKGGATLPSTGGMGTTALYTIGGLMVAGAAVLFVVRKRMAA